MADIDLYLTLNASEKAEMLDAASRKRGIAVSVMEKDYWVCKTLAVLFRLPKTTLKPAARNLHISFPPCGSNSAPVPTIGPPGHER